jgi:hypothetical protein
VTDGQVGVVCPQCGSAANVHSIQELSAMAQSRLNMMPGSPRSPQGYPGAAQPGTVQPGTVQPGMGQPGTGQPGWAQEPQPSTGQQPGWTQEPQPSTGQQPGWARAAQPGWAQEPTQGQQSGPGNWRGSRARDYDTGSIGDNIIDSIGEDIAGAALGAAARFIGRRIGRKMQTTFNDKVMPAMAARQDEMLRRQVEIAQRHPDLRACMSDQVVFLAGGSRVLPMKDINMQMTVEESDTLVAQLRGY